MIDPMRWKVAGLVVMAVVLTWGMFVAFAERAPGVAPIVPSALAGAAEPLADVAPVQSTASPVDRGRGTVAERSEVSAGGVHGVVVDDLGEPIVKVLVYLRQHGARESGAVMCCTDAAGRFAFPKARDTITLTVENDLVPPLEVLLPAGERPFLELRASLPVVELTGTLRSARGPVPDRWVQVKADGRDERAWTMASTHADGSYRHLLPVGRYDLAVAAPTFALDRQDAVLKPTNQQTSRLPMSLIVLDGRVRRVRHDLWLPSATVEVSVREALARTPVAGAPVRVFAQRGTDELWQRGTTDAQGKVVFDELPPATWSVALDAQDFAATASQVVVLTGSGTERHEVAFEVVRAGGVLVSFGKLGEVPGGDFLHVANVPFGRIELPATFALEDQLGGRIEGQHLFDDAPLAAGLVFARVPVGRHVLRCEDRREPAGVLYAAMNPFVRDAVDVRAGDATTVSVEVERRPILQVVVRDTDGAFWPLPVQVVGPHGAVVLLPVRVAQFMGGTEQAAPHQVLRASGANHLTFAPAGDYRVIVAAPSGPVEQRVTIAASDVVHTITVPGKAPADEPTSSR